jgi:hypothetical protein
MVAIVNPNIPKGTVQVDVHRGYTRWERYELVDPDNLDAGGALPNVGDWVTDYHPSGKDKEDIHGIISAVNMVDLTTYRFTTIPVPLSVVAGQETLDIVEELEASQAPVTESVEVFRLSPGEIPIRNEKGDLIGNAHVGAEFQMEPPNPNDLKPRFLGGPGRPDPAILAKAKLAARVATRATLKAIRWTIASIISLVIIVVVLTVTYGYKHMKTDNFTYERSCSMALDKDLVITGKRSYTYKYQEVFGYRFTDTSTSFEKTTLDVRNIEMTVVGQYTKPKPIDPTTGVAPPGEERWWAIQTGIGDKDARVLKGADNYTFVVGKRVGVVTYDSFCR